MKNTFSLFLLVALAYGQTAYGQTANVQKSLATATLNQISGDLTFGSGKTLTMQSGSTLYAQSLTATGTNNNITLTPSGTGGVLFPDGSASSPAIAFVAAGGPLGLYRTGNSINFSSTGTRVFYVSTQGITVNGSDSLGSASSPLIAISAAGTTGFFQTAAGSIGISNVGILTLTLDSSQNATFAGTAITLASAAAKAGLRIPHGAAPTTPTDGDMWSTNSGLFIRIYGVTKTVTLT